MDKQPVYCPLCGVMAKHDLEDLGIFYCDRCKMFFERDGTEIDVMERLGRFADVAKDALERMKRACIDFAEKVGPAFRKALEKLKEHYPDLEEDDDGQNEVSS